MKTVTYKGPTDPADPTTAYVIGDHELPVGEPVSVPEEVAAECEATEGHDFEVSSKKPKEPAKGKKQEA